MDNSPSDLTSRAAAFLAQELPTGGLACLYVPLIEELAAEVAHYESTLQRWAEEGCECAWPNGQCCAEQLRSGSADDGIDPRDYCGPCRANHVREWRDVEPTNAAGKEDDE